MGNSVSADDNSGSFWSNIKDGESIIRILEYNLRNDFFLNSATASDEIPDVGGYEYALPKTISGKINLLADKMKNYLNSGLGNNTEKQSIATRLEHLFAEILLSRSNYNQFVTTVHKRLVTLLSTYDTLLKSHQNYNQPYVSSDYQIKIADDDVKDVLNFYISVVIEAFNKNPNAVHLECMNEYILAALKNMSPLQLWEELSPAILFVSNQIQFKKQTVKSSHVDRGSNVEWSLASNDDYWRAVTINDEDILWTCELQNPAIEYALPCDYANKILIELYSDESDIKPSNTQTISIHRQLINVKLNYTEKISRIGLTFHYDDNSSTQSKTLSIKHIQLYDYKNDSLEVSKRTSYTTILSSLYQPPSSKLLNILLLLSRASGLLSSSLNACRIFLQCEDDEEDKNSFLKLKEPVKEKIFEIKSELTSSFIKNSTIEATFDATKSSPRIQLSDRNRSVESTSSSNTHVLVNQSFTTPGIYYWTFKLENDVLNDEMTCFGAATSNNITNSSYENSPNLYMYRAFNGQLYQLGVKKGTLDKIHPHDTVTTELNLITGTISFSINKQPFKLAFSDVKAPIWPAVCFYGSSKQVSILSVEIPRSISNDYKTLESVDKTVNKVTLYDGIYDFKGIIPTHYYEAYTVKDIPLELTISTNQEYYHVVGYINVSPNDYSDGDELRITIENVNLLNPKENSEIYVESFTSSEEKQYKYDLHIEKYSIIRLTIKRISGESSYKVGLVDTLFYSKSIYESMYPKDNIKIETTEDCVISYINILNELSKLSLEKKQILSHSELPYWYEFSTYSFKAFTSLLKLIREKKYSNKLLLSVQQLLLYNLIAINKSRIDPKEFGLYKINENGEYVLCQELIELQSIVDEYISNIDDSLNDENIKLFAQIVIKGSTLFRPSTTDRNTTTLSYILNLSHNNNSKGNSVFISHIISLLSYDSEILFSLFQGIFNCKSNLVDTMLPIFHSLLETIYKLIIDHIEDKCGVTDVVLNSAIHFLFNYFYYFFMHVVLQANHDSVIILTKYVMAFLVTIKKLSTYIVNKNITKELLQKVLNYSIFKEMFPLLLIFIYSLSDEIYLSSQLLSITVEIAIDFDKICDKSQECKDYDIKLMNNDINEWSLMKYLPKPINIFDVLYTGERDNVSGNIGFVFEPRKPLVIYSLGRAVNQSISKGKLKSEHILQLLDLKQNIVIATCSVNKDSPIDELGYAYCDLYTPIILQPDKSYVLCSSETANSGDPWYSRDLRGKEIYKNEYITVVNDYLKTGNIISTHTIKNSGYGMATLFVSENYNYRNYISLLPHIQFSEEIDESYYTSATLIDGCVFNVDSKNKRIYHTVEYQNCIVEFIIKINRISEDSLLNIGYSFISDEEEEKENEGKEEKDGEDGEKKDNRIKEYYFSSTHNQLTYNNGNNRFQLKNTPTYQSGDIIVISLDTTNGSFSMKHNMTSYGIFYGPESLFPCVVVDTKNKPLSLELEIKNCNIEITLSNIYKHEEIPLLLDIQKTLLLLCGKLSSTMIKSIKITDLENKVEPYLKWNLMKGGLESNYDLLPLQSDDYPIDLKLPDGSDLYVKSDGKRDDFEHGDNPIIEYFKNPETNESINFLKWLNDKYSNKAQQLQYSMGRFPLVESIYCSVLLKHTGLLEKAEKIISKIIDNNNDVNVDLSEILNDEDSEAFCSINTSICELRMFLLNRKNEYRQIDESKITPTNPELEKYKPTTFEKYQESVLSRLNYLLTISSYMHNEINEISTYDTNKSKATSLPFLKFKSMDSSFRSKKDSYENNLYSDTFDAEEVSGDDSDDDQTELYNEDITNTSNRIESICKSCIFYVEEGNFVPPDEIYSVLSLRQTRLLYRIYGFKWLNYLIQNIKLRTSIDCSLFTFRSSLRGNLYVVKDDDILYQKHHYSSCLDGINARNYKLLRDSFNELYETFLVLLNDSLRPEEQNFSLIHLILYNLSLHYTTQDYISMDFFSLFRNLATMKKDYNNKSIKNSNSSNDAFNNNNNNNNPLSWLNYLIWDKKQLIEAISNGEYTIDQLQSWLQQFKVDIDIKNNDKNLLIEPMEKYYETINSIKDDIAILVTIPDRYSSLPFYQKEATKFVEKTIQKTSTNLLLYFLLFQFNDSVHVNSNTAKFTLRKGSNDGSSLSVPSIQGSIDQDNDDMKKTYLSYISDELNRMAKEYKNEKNQITSYMLQNKLNGIPKHHHIDIYKTSLFGLKRILENGSYNMQIAILHFFQLSLPSTPPSSAPPGIGILPTLYNLISKPFIFNKDMNNQTVELGEYYNMQVLSSEAILLLKLLLSSDNWSELIMNDITNKFTQLNKLSNVLDILTDKQFSLYKDIVAILSISCSNSEVLRVGGKVQFINDNTAVGTIVTYSPSSQPIHLLFSNQISSQIYHTTCDKVKSVSTMECCLIHIPEIYDFALSFILQIDRNRSDNNNNNNNNNSIESINGYMMLEKIMEFLYVQSQYKEIIPEIINRNIHKYILSIASKPSPLDCFLSTDTIYDRYNVLLGTVYQQKCKNGELLYQSLKKETATVIETVEVHEETLSAAERAKRELAENLSSALTLDVAVCIRALERNDNDADRAGEWLIEGGREVEILIAQEQEHSTLEDKFQCSQVENEILEDEDVEDEDDEYYEDPTMKSKINNIMQVCSDINRKVVCLLLEINQNDEDKALNDYYDDEDYWKSLDIPDKLDIMNKKKENGEENEVVIDNKSILDDQGTATSFRCEDRTDEQSKEKLSVSKKYQTLYGELAFDKNAAKILKGTLVSVKDPEAIHSDIIMRDINGLIYEDCISTEIAKVKLYDHRNDVVYLSDFKPKSLKIHKTIFNNDTNNENSITQSFVDTIQGLYYSYCRKFLFSVYKCWNNEIPFTVDNICEKNDDLKMWIQFIILFMTSENVLNIIVDNEESTTSTSKVKNELLNDLKLIYRKLLLSDDRTTQEIMTKVTTSEIIRNFQSPSVTTDAYRFKDSPHPLRKLKEYGSVLKISKAGNIKLSLDKDTKIPDNSVIKFYSDSDHTHLLTSYTNKDTLINGYAVAQNIVYFEYINNNSTINKSEDWGFRIIITSDNSSNEWNKESDVYDKPNLSWANWLLDSIRVTALESEYSIDSTIYNSMITYIRTPGNLYKTKVVNMLSSLLSNIPNYKVLFKPDLSVFNEMEVIISERCYTLFTDKNNYFLPPGILALLELIYHEKIVNNYISGTPFLRVNTDIPLTPPYSLDIVRADAPFSAETLLKAFLEMSILAYSISKHLLISDNIFNGIWLDSCYYTHSIETPHPINNNIQIEGDFYYASTTQIKVIFSPLCKLCEGFKFSLQYDDGFLNYDANTKLINFTISTSKVHYEIDTSNCDIKDENYYGLLLLLYTDNLNSSHEKNVLKENEKEIIKDLLEMKSFESGADAEIVLYCNKLSKNLKVSALDLNSNQILLSENDLISNTHLPNLSEKMLLLRFNLLKYFNKRISQCIRLVNMKNIGSNSNVNGNNSGNTINNNNEENNFLGSLMNSLGSCIFFDLKNQIIQLSIEQTRINGLSTDTSVTLDNAKSFESISNNEIEPSISQCIFMQYYKQLNEKPSKIYRHSLDDKGRLITIKYQNESGVDWGGLFRDSISQGVSDLFSDHLTLLIPCSNARNTTNINMDKYIPNPIYNSNNYLGMYEFVGILMGISLRFEYSLPFDFPSIVWKYILNIKPCLDDLYQIDTVTVGLLSQLQDKSLTEEQFNELFNDLTFTTPSSNGCDIEVTAGGASMSVTYDKRSYYADLVLETRLHEFDMQLHAIQRGFGSVVPLHSLSMFTWEELEYLVCGTSVIDIKELKSHTTYSGYTPSDPTIEHFWKVLESWDDSERSLWIRFCWGRSRLPSKKWPNEFKISKQGNVKSLPTAHTCFFSVDLPPYRTYEETEKAMSICIHFGVAGVLNT